MKYILTILALATTLSLSAQVITPQEVAPRKDIKEQLASPAKRDSLTTIYETVQITEKKMVGYRY